MVYLLLLPAVIVVPSLLDVSPTLLLCRAVLCCAVPCSA
jgi:hypothetical protein